jgi:hypothetical protein
MSTIAPAMTIMATGLDVIALRPVGCRAGLWPSLAKIHSQGQVTTSFSCYNTRGPVLQKFEPLAAHFLDYLYQLNKKIINLVNIDVIQR